MDVDLFWAIRKIDSLMETGNRTYAQRVWMRLNGDQRKQMLMKAGWSEDESDRLAGQPWGEFSDQDQGKLMRVIGPKPAEEAHVDFHTGIVSPVVHSSPE